MYFTPVRNVKINEDHYGKTPLCFREQIRSEAKLSNHILK